MLLLPVSLLMLGTPTGQLHHGVSKGVTLSWHGWQAEQLEDRLGIRSLILQDAASKS